MTLDLVTSQGLLFVIGYGWWPLVQLDSVLQFQVCTNMGCFVAQPFFHPLPVQSLLVLWKLTYNVKFLHPLIKFCFLETRTLQWSNNLVAFKVHITVTIFIFFAPNGGKYFLCWNTYSSKRWCRRKDKWTNRIIAFCTVGTKELFIFNW